ncbi:hypothetical protein LguiA_023918 [Lonicera macranthoides]
MNSMMFHGKNVYFRSGLQKTPSTQLRPSRSTGYFGVQDLHGLQNKQRATELSISSSPIVLDRSIDVIEADGLACRPKRFWGLSLPGRISGLYGPNYPIVVLHLSAYFCNVYRPVKKSYNLAIAYSRVVPLEGFYICNPTLNQFTTLPE